MATTKEFGSMRAIVDNDIDALSPFVNPLWIAFAIQDGSNMFQKGEYERLDPITKDLEQFNSIPVRNPTTGTINAWLVPPAIQGEPPTIGNLLLAAYGSEVVIEAQTPAVEPTVPTGTELEVPGPTPYKVGMAIKIPLTSGGEAVAWITDVQADVPAPATDTITFAPAITPGDFVATEVPASVHYRTKTGGNAGEYPILQIDQLDDDADERWGWLGCKIASMTLAMGAGAVFTPNFTLQGISEVQETGETGEIPDPDVSNVFIGKNIFIQKDAGNPVWVSNFQVTHNNSLVQVNGAEAEYGISGFAEDRRVPQVALDYKYESSADRINFKNGDRFSLSAYARSNVGSLGTPDYRYCAIHMPSILAEDFNLTTPSGKVLKYDVTGLAFPADRAAEDSVTISIL